MHVYTSEFLLSFELVKTGGYTIFGGAKFSFIVPDYPLDYPPICKYSWKGVDEEDEREILGDFLQRQFIGDERGNMDHKRKRGGYIGGVGDEERIGDRRRPKRNIERTIESARVVW